VDDGDVLVQGVHRDPGRPPPPDRPRPPLNEKIADLQHIIQPSSSRSTRSPLRGSDADPDPFPLGLIIMATARSRSTRCAARSSASDPATVDHIRLASEHGFGLDRHRRGSRYAGDVTLDEARARAKGFRSAWSGSRSTSRARASRRTPARRRPPSRRLLLGRLPGAIEEAIEILRCSTRRPTGDAAAPRRFGAYQGGIDARPGEKVVFIGDCAAGRHDPWQAVAIENLYRESLDARPHTIEGQDVFAKLASARKKLAGDVVRLEGCPVSVAEQVWRWSISGGSRTRTTTAKAC